MGWTSESAASLAIARREDVVALVALGLSEERATNLLLACGGMRGVANASAAELAAHGIGVRNASRIAAAFSLSRSGLLAGDRPRSLMTAEDTFALLAPRLAHLEQEVFVVISIDIRNGILDTVEIARGTAHQVEVHPRDVFRAAIRVNAAAIVVAHNHPTGDPEPSPDDIAITKRLRECGALLGVPLIDHIVIGGKRYRSIAEQLGSQF